MSTITILAIFIACAIAGTIFLACEDVTTCFMAALLAFVFFWAIGGAMLALMPEFTNNFIVTPTGWLFDKVGALVKHFFAWIGSHNPLIK